MRQAKSKSHAPLNKVMVQFSHELGVLAKSLNAVEHAVGLLMDHSRPAAGTSMRDLQSLDLLRQTLESLSGYADRLARNLPEEITIDAAKAAGPITLAALAERLGGCGISPKDSQSPSDEDPEYF